MKYDSILNENINRGKVNYKKYLQSELEHLKKKPATLHTQSEVARIKYSCGKVHNIKRFGCIITHRWLF
jgi:hypothetical protein